MWFRTNSLSVCFNLSLLFWPISSYRVLELPDIKAEKWMDSAIWEIWEESAEWNTDFSELPPEAFKIVDRGSTYIASQHLSGLGIVCNASYPVEWIFEQAEHADEDAYNIIMKTARESRDVTNSRNDRFIAILEIFGDVSTVTGNYICKGLGNVNVEKSVFLYWEGSSPPYLVLSGRTVHVKSEDNNTLVLPCYVSQPDVDVRLQQEISGVFQPVSSGIGIKFDPRIGFVFDLRKMMSKNVYGRFKCVTDVEDDEVDILVETGLRPQRQFANVISPGTGIVYDEDREEIVCCSRSGKPPPTLHNIFCINPSMCRMREHKLYKVGNNGKKIINGSCISDPVYLRDHGILRCKGDGIDVFRTFYTDFANLEGSHHINLYFNFKDIVPEKMMSLLIHNRSPYFHMQIITATCEGMNSYFSDGHKWAVRWRNKSLTFFEPIEYDDDPHIHGVRHADVHLHWKMYELICYVPVWNSTEWVSKSVVLDVQKSSLPTIEGPPQEEINLVLNDTEKILECKSIARPLASLSWKKNGEDVSQNMIIFKANGTSILIFHRVGHDTQGEYKCIAKNLVGEVQKVINVYVEDDSGSAWGTTAAILVPILIIAFVLTAGALVWKMQLQKKIVDHLSRVVFREQERQTET